MQSSRLLGKFASDWNKGLGSLPQISGKTEQALADAERAVLINGKSELEPVVRALRAAHDNRDNREAMLAHFDEAVATLRAVEDNGEEKVAEAEKWAGRKAAERYQSLLGAGTQVATRTKTAKALYLGQAVKGASVKLSEMSNIDVLWKRMLRALRGGPSTATFRQVANRRLATKLMFLMGAIAREAGSSNARRIVEASIDRVREAERIARDFITYDDDIRMRRAFEQVEEAIYEGHSDWNRARNMIERLGLGATRPPRRSAKAPVGNLVQVSSIWKFEVDPAMPRIVNLLKRIANSDDTAKYAQQWDRVYSRLSRRFYKLERALSGTGREAEELRQRVTIMNKAMEDIAGEIAEARRAKRRGSGKYEMYNATVRATAKEILHYANRIERLTRKLPSPTRSGQGGKL